MLQVMYKSMEIKDGKQIFKKNMDEHNLLNMVIEAATHHKMEVLSRTDSD